VTVGEVRGAGVGENGVPPTPWTGEFVARQIGVRVRTDAAHSLMAVESLVGLALRRNPRRAHLLVSTVLAKHVPTVPALAVGAGELLGLLVGEALGVGRMDTGLAREFERALGRADADAVVLAAVAEAASVLPPARNDVVTIGYAETATGLGHLVAGVIGSPYLHSTRHAPPPGAPAFGFEEEHSHATVHRLHPTRQAWLTPGGTAVLVDDEISTGRTVINTIAELHAAVPQSRWVVAALIDLRAQADRSQFDTLADQLGTRIDVVALGTGAVDLPADISVRARELIKARSEHVEARSEEVVAPPHACDGSPLGEVVMVDVDVTPIRSARFGNQGRIEADLVELVAARIRPLLEALEPSEPSEPSAPSAGSASPGGAVPADHRILLLGSEEFIALPLRVAERLGRDLPGIRFSTTTRSPIAVIDEPGYAVASGLAFGSHDDTLDAPGVRFAYNLSAAAGPPAAIVLLPEPGTDSARLLEGGGIVDALRRVAPRVVVVELPADLPDPDDWIADQ
jgi:hypothetical protein